MRYAGQLPEAILPAMKQTSKRWAYAALGLGVIIISSSSIMTRYAQAAGVSSLSIAAIRLVLASVILMPLAFARSYREIQAATGRDLLLAMAAGGLLAAHFATWISSLAYTSVASSTALVTTNPIWIAAASVILFHERMRKGLIAAIGFALCGSVLIFLADGGAGGAQPNPALGNTLALIGSLAVSGYLLIGRSLRQRLSLLAYVWLVYTSAAIALVAAALLAQEPLWGFSPAAWAFLIGIALGPQLMGHTIFNWALKQVSATFIALSILGEPIGSSILALLLFDEGFSPMQITGFVLLLGGIYLGARSEYGNDSSARAESRAPQESADA
jgi:drug/metabolite transporter (DMT)-like permease